ncbi:MAG: hypothetical protein ABI600_03940, partial [Luteolibacter sp.]
WIDCSQAAPLIAQTNGSGVITIIDEMNGDIVSMITSAIDHYGQVRFSTDGKIIFVGPSYASAADGFFCAFDATTGEELLRIPSKGMFQILRGGDAALMINDDDTITLILTRENIVVKKWPAIPTLLGGEYYRMDVATDESTALILGSKKAYYFDLSGKYNEYEIVSVPVKDPSQLAAQQRVPGYEKCRFPGTPCSMCSSFPYLACAIQSFVTPSPTVSATPTASYTPTVSATASFTPSESPTDSATPSASASPTHAIMRIHVVDAILGYTASSAEVDANGDGHIDSADVVKSANGR